MRRMLAVVAFLTLAAFLTSQAVAYDLPAINEHRISMSLKDASELYTDPGGTTELRAVFVEDDIISDGSVPSIPHNALGLTNPDGYDIAEPPGQVSGLLYDLELAGYTDSSGVFHTPDASTLAFGNTLMFVPLGRNPAPGTPADGSGGVVEMYFDPTPDLQPNPETNTTPDKWVEGEDEIVATRDSLDMGGGVATGPRDAGETLLLQGVFEPLLDHGYAPGGLTAAIEATIGARVVYAVSIVGAFDGASGGLGVVGKTFVNIIGGSSMGAVRADALTNGITSALFDVQLRNTVNELAGGLASASHWDTTSRDPVIYIGTPEPASMLVWGLLAVGSAGYGIRKRRRMK